ncbi:hypothetical protein [uncultured Agrococcus sp.]|uniref:hypothetical protein n=1 Tax=uncultured Agrococcus sp. TaxID=382258 RepID=UPI0025DB098D|nr:hypothetical protein [uncultured Agrococcus sp.]
MTLIWMGLATLFGIGAVLYLGLGVVMTNTLDGVFGSEPQYLFNWVILWIAIIGQLLGFAASLTVALLALRDKKRQRRLAKAATIMGFIGAGGFLILGVMQVPLWSILLDALTL